MNKKLFTLLIAALCISNVSFANIFRVGYTGTPLAGVDYTTVQEANDAANAGDTIQIYGTVTGGYITKRLVILGFGYNLDVHPGLQVVAEDAPSYSSISFMGGSDGSIVKGVSVDQFRLYASDYNDGTAVPISNITFERCCGNFFFYNISINSNYGSISNINIIACAIPGSIYLESVGQSDGGSPLTGLLIANSVFGSSGGGIVISNPGTTATILNCVFIGNITLRLYDAQVLVKNCIYDGNANYPPTNGSNINTIFENNLFSQAQPSPLPPGSSNLWGQATTNIFVTGDDDNSKKNPADIENFDETFYTLKAGSPALGAGLNASNQPTDCGIFGGEPAYKYVISGIPPIPAIYQLTAPGQAATVNPYNITISVRSNN